MQALKRLRRRYSVAINMLAGLLLFALLAMGGVDYEQQSTRMETDAGKERSLSP